jgi:mono/diheme cytochrome c family protein
MRPLPTLACTSLALVFVGCSSSGGSSGSAGGTTGLEIVTVSGGTLSASAGDALALKVVSHNADGTTQDIPAAQVTWSGPPTVAASDPTGMAASNSYPATGSTPVAFWIANAPRTDHASDLAGVLFVLDPGTSGSGTVAVTATVSGSGGGTATASVVVSASPAGDATRGATLYGTSGAVCAECHGTTGHGSPDSADGTTFLIDGQSYSFPAAGLNAEDGNAVAEWTPALFAIATRADLDDEAVSLRLPMPDWLTAPSPASMRPLSTQDLADIFAYLATQKQ